MDVYDKKDINEYQKQKYQFYEMQSADSLIKKYENGLTKFVTRNKPIRILDIGGGSGFFAMALHRYLGGLKHDIYVLEITKYDTWNQFSDSIHFIECSAFDAGKYFDERTFDIIFVNYVFHHLVQDSWKKTVSGINFMLASIGKLLKDDGMLCISECYYYGFIMKWLSSFLIYTLSTIKLSTVSRFLRGFGSKSAGVGVCFLSQNKWKDLFSQNGYSVVSLYETPVKTIKIILREQFFNYVVCKNSAAKEKLENVLNCKLLEQNPIRIAHIMGKMMAGGVESVVINYYRHIDRKKVQFDFIIDEDSTIVPYEEIEKLGGRVFKIPPYQNPVAYHKALLKIFCEYKYRIVHSHINTLSVFPLFAAKRACVPVRIAHSHSTAGKGETMRNVLKYALRPFSMAFPTHLCACSEYAGRWLFGDKLYYRGKVMLVKNAIDTSKFMFDPLVRKAVREELNIEGKFIVGHVGRFMKQKNHTFLIDIFEQIHIQRPDSVLLLVGEGELEQEIRDKVSRSGLADCVQFLGIRDDVNRLLQSMDVLLLPSLYEGLPVVGIEAQASGLAVFVSDKVTEEAKISEDFMYVPLKESAEKWAEKILSYRPNTRKTAIQQTLEAGYDIEMEAEKLKDFYMIVNKDDSL